MRNSGTLRQLTLDWPTALIFSFAILARLLLLTGPSHS